MESGDYEKLEESFWSVYSTTLYVSILYFAPLYASKISAESVFRSSQLRLNWSTQRQVMVPTEDKIWVLSHDELAWYPLDTLPTNTIPYVRRALDNYRRGIWFDSYGWDRHGL
jgi:hypothetical protein